MVPVWTLADRLRKSREQVGVSQKALAEALGVTMRQIQAAENSEVTPKPILIMGYAMISGVDIDWLETGKEKPSGPDGPDGDKLPDLDSNQEPPGLRIGSITRVDFSRPTANRTNRKAA